MAYTTFRKILIICILLCIHLYSYAQVLDCLPNEQVTITLKTYTQKCAHWNLVAKDVDVVVHKTEVKYSQDALIEEKTFTISVAKPGEYHLHFALNRAWEKSPIDTREMILQCYKTITKTINVTIGGRLVEVRLPIDKPLPKGKTITLQYGDESIELQLAD